jgi:hypothetical protein
MQKRSIGRRFMMGIGALLLTGATLFLIRAADSELDLKVYGDNTLQTPLLTPTFVFLDPQFEGTFRREMLFPGAGRLVTGSGIELSIPDDTFKNVSTQWYFGSGSKAYGFGISELSFLGDKNQMWGYSGNNDTTALNVLDQKVTHDFSFLCNGWRHGKGEWIGYSGVFKLEREWKDFTQTYIRSFSGKPVNSKGMSSSTLGFIGSGTLCRKIGSRTFVALTAEGSHDLVDTIEEFSTADHVEDEDDSEVVADHRVQLNIALSSLVLISRNSILTARIGIRTGICFFSDSSYRYRSEYSSSTPFVQTNNRHTKSWIIGSEYGHRLGVSGADILYGVGLSLKVQNEKQTYPFEDTYYQYAQTIVVKAVLTLPLRVAFDIGKYGKIVFGMSPVVMGEEQWFRQIQESVKAPFVCQSKMLQSTLSDPNLLLTVSPSDRFSLTLRPEISSAGMHCGMELVGRF